MAVYTVIDKRELADLVEDYGLIKLSAAHGIPFVGAGSTFCASTR